MSAASLLRLSGVQLFLMSLRTFDGRPGFAPDLDSFFFFSSWSPSAAFLILGPNFQNESKGPGISRLGAVTAIKLRRGSPFGSDALQLFLEE